MEVGRLPYECKLDVQRKIRIKLETILDRARIPDLNYEFSRKLFKNYYKLL